MNPTQSSTDSEHPWQGFQFINQLDRSLKAVASLHAQDSSNEPIQLKVGIYYHNEFVGSLSFFLHKYDDQEAMSLAKNIGSSEFIVDAIDQYLAGDVVE